MLKSILLPLAFSYSATTFFNATSSSCTKPCDHHMVAVVAAALAIEGHATLPAAASAKALRRNERLVRSAMTVPSLCPRTVTRCTHPPSELGSALHVMLFLANLIRALLIFNGLRSRHCQRAFLGYHYRLRCWGAGEA